MSLKSKARAAKQRAHKKRMLETEQQNLDKEFKRLKGLTGGFALDKRSTPKAKPVTEYRNYQGFLPPKADPVHVTTDAVKLTDSMVERERRAQVVAKERSKLVMPVFNKGGYQLPTESDLADFKAGLLRRRS